MPREPLFIQAMQGLGDTLFERAVLREALKVRADIYIETSWPQLMRGLPVKCVRPTTRLRTQQKNIDRSTHWHTLPGLVDARRWHYAHRMGVTILQALLDDLGLKADTIDFSGPPVAPVDREPYIVVRPCTNRLEWQALARNPRPEYLCRAVDALRSRYRIVSVADICPPYEEAIGPLPYADERFHRGELHVEQLLALVAGAAAVIGGVGWLVPAAVAYSVSMLLLFGGWGMHHGPQRIFDARMDTSRIHQVLPDRFCMCSQRDHDCDKRIADLDGHIERFALGVDAARQAAVAAGDRRRLVSSRRTAV